MKETTRSTCTKCKAGTKCPTGSSKVASCPPGSFSAVGSSACSPCGADNTYSTGSAERCSTCLPGWFTSGGGSTSTRASCNQCLGGTCDGTSVITGDLSSWACGNTCADAATGTSLSNNGVCEDGGPGSSAATCGLGTDCGDCGYRPSTSACGSGWGYRFWKANGKNGLYGHFCYAKVASGGGGSGCDPALTGDEWKSRVVQTVAPENDAALIGTYCMGGSATSCKVCKMPANIPAGYFNKGKPPGATITTSYGSKSYDLAECSEGTYNDEDWSDPTVMVACKKCKAGHFGADGAPLGEKSRGFCSGSCAPGYYCVEGSTTNQAAPCRAGYYGAKGAQTTADCDGACPVGYWCPAASVTDKAHKCRAGFYGDAPGQVSDACVGECPAGYTCPAGTSTVGVAPSAPCTDAGSYCPKKSAQALSVPAGYRGVQDTNGNNVDVTPCGVGTWCVNGVVNKCPAGSFGASSGLQTNECSGKCSAGYYCPEGSKEAVEEECGNLAVRSGEKATKYFCAAASAAPTLVKPGYFTACEDDSTTLCAANRRVKELPCGAGFLCADGLQKRAVQWDASFCTCEKSSDGTDVCTPTNPSTSDGDMILDEQPGQLVAPWGPQSYLTWGRAVKASWNDEGGGEGAVSTFSITNVRRYDFSPGAAVKTCALATGSSATLPHFRLDPAAAKADQRVQYMLDFEECLGWAFDIVAESGSASYND